MDSIGTAMNPVPDCCLRPGKRDTEDIAPNDDLGWQQTADLDRSGVHDDKQSVHIFPGQCRPPGRSDTQGSPLGRRHNERSSSEGAPPVR